MLRGVGDAWDAYDSYDIWHPRMRTWDIDCRNLDATALGRWSNSHLWSFMHCFLFLRSKGQLLAMNRQNLKLFWLSLESGWFRSGTTWNNALDNSAAASSEVKTCQMIWTGCSSRRVKRKHGTPSLFNIHSSLLHVIASLCLFWAFSPFLNGFSYCHSESIHLQADLDGVGALDFTTFIAIAIGSEDVGSRNMPKKCGISESACFVSHSFFHLFLFNGVSGSMLFGPKWEQFSCLRSRFSI